MDAAGNRAPPDLPAGKEYHAFIAYNSADEDWVDELIKCLESSQNGFRCVNHLRDFHGGKPVVANINEFLEKSWKYLVILTPQFVASDWCKFETDVMMHLSVEQKEDTVIPILLKPCKIPKTLEHLTYVEVGSKHDWQDKVLKALRRQRDYLEDTMDSLRDQSSARQTLQNYEKDMAAVEKDKKFLQNDVHAMFDTLVDILETHRKRRLDEVQIHTEDRKINLSKMKHAAERILSLNEDLEKSQLNFDMYECLKNEQERLSKREQELACHLVTGEDAIKKIEVLTIDVGSLQMMRTCEQRDSFLKAISPSWAIFPKGNNFSPRSYIQCPQFFCDQKTKYIKVDGTTYIMGTTRTLFQSKTSIASGRIFWMNTFKVQLEMKVGPERSVFRVSLKPKGGGIKTEYHGWIGLTVFACAQHDHICMKIWRAEKHFHHQFMKRNIPLQWDPLCFGFLLNMEQKTWTIYDMNKEEEIATVPYTEDVEELTPCFWLKTSGVNVDHTFTTGTDIEMVLSDNMKALLQKKSDSQGQHEGPSSEEEW